MPARALFIVLACLGVSAARAGEFPGFAMREIDPHVGEVCYALTIADVNADNRPDVVAVSENAVVWYESPQWTKHDIIRDATVRDNVCIQPYDIDGDGKVDFALGAAWRPTDTKAGGTLQWLKREASGWRVISIGEEPTLHRMRFGDPDPSGKMKLIVAPLQGRGTKGPDWGAGAGSRVLVYTIPARPDADRWTFEVADDSLHTIHNLQAVDFDDDGKLDILLAAWEGVFLLKRDPSGKWTKTRLGTGNQESKPNKGASEIKLGKLADGAKYIATIEPWHGFQVVVYTPPESGEPLWRRHVVDEGLAWGHAVWCANLDDDDDQELIIGQRDKSKVADRDPAGPGLFVYDPLPRAPGAPLAFKRRVIDNGGVAVEDALAADLNGDGAIDLVAGGRATHNVRIYMNQRLNK